MQSLFWLSENEAVCVWIKEYDQTLQDSRYLEVPPLFSHFKNFHVRIFFAHFWRRLTMFGGEVSNLPKASASEAEDKCGDYAVYMKA